MFDERAAAFRRCHRTNLNMTGDARKHDGDVNFDDEISIRNEDLAIFGEVVN